MRWLFLLGALGVVGCADPGAFVCESDAQCSSGTCEATGYCSFPDGECGSGRRYGEHAGQLAGTCVGEVGEGTGSEGSGSTADASSSAGPTMSTDPDPTTGATGSPEPMCGNGVIDTGEACDGSDLDGVDCRELSFSGGALACTSACTFDIADCSVCGDGAIEDGEACDGNDLAGVTCEGLGFFTGALACGRDCTSFDQAGCSNCGNGQIDLGEVCDSTIPDITCNDLGLQGGGMQVITCSDTCDSLDTDSCDNVNCHAEPNVVFGDCPAACDSCDETTCLIDCTGSSACANDIIYCPEGWACHVECSGSSACADATIECPTYHSCTVACAGSSGCLDADVECGDAGMCHLLCGLEANVCSGTDLDCGDDACVAECASTDSEPPAVDCGTSCECVACMPG